MSTLGEETGVFEECFLPPWVASFKNPLLFRNPFFCFSAISTHGSPTPPHPFPLLLKKLASLKLPVFRKCQESKQPNVEGCTDQTMMSPASVSKLSASFSVTIPIGLVKKKNFGLCTVTSASTDDGFLGRWIKKEPCLSGRFAPFLLRVETKPLVRNKQTKKLRFSSGR